MGHITWRVFFYTHKAIRLLKGCSVLIVAWRLGLTLHLKSSYITLPNSEITNMYHHSM